MADIAPSAPSSATVTPLLPDKVSVLRYRYALGLEHPNRPASLPPDTPDCLPDTTDATVLSTQHIASCLPPLRFQQRRAQGRKDFRATLDDYGCHCLGQERLDQFDCDNASSTTNNKVPTPTTIKSARTVEGSMRPLPVRPRASLSTTTSPTGISHARVSSTSSMLGRPGAKSPAATTTTGPRRPTSMSGTELLRQAKLAAPVANASTLSDVDRSTSKQGLSDSGSDKKEDTMRPSPRLIGSMPAASKR